MTTMTVLPEYRTSYTVKARSRAGEHEGDMEGSTHAATGFLLGTGVGLLTQIGTHAHGVAVADNIGRDLMFGVLTAGFALLPDADHPQASFAYAAGGLSHGVSHLVAFAFGGHRQGFHSLVGIGLMTVVTASCATWWPNKWALSGLALLIAVCVVAGLKATGFLRHGGRGRNRHRGALRRALVGIGIAAAAIVTVRADLWWLVALGMALHVLEDETTGHGCALLWPLTSRRFGGDGHQPARGRKPSAKGRRPRSGYQQAKAKATRPVAPRSPSRPPLSPGKGAISMCLVCLAGNCEECKGQGCRCPQPDTSHPKRPSSRKPAAPAAELPDTPPF
jgi:membrane-bound metal-dependent hydrolase YbcI (DUF457 family)